MRDAQRYDQSLRECQEVVRLDPLAPFTYVAAGWTLLDMGRPGQAQHEFHKALEIDPNYPAGLYFLARADQQQGRVQEAIELLQKAVASAGRTPKYLSALANAYLTAGNKAEAQKILEELRRQAAKGYVDPQMLSSLAARLKG